MDMAKRTLDTPVGSLEVAEFLGVAKRTVHQWQYRNLLPPHDFDAVNGTGAWKWGTILKWAGDTGRLDRMPALKGVYTKTFAKKVST